jgi:ribonuclease BN (tRNA processing enzyme)
MRVQFLGSGDAFGSGGRFNTCIFVADKGDAFLIDCGASSMIAMRKYAIDPNRIRKIFVSHLHGDHFGGLPFFILDAQFYSRRTAPLALIGPQGFKTRLAEAMEVFFPGSSTARRKFEIEITEIAAGETHAISRVTVSSVEVKHACGAPPLALRLTCADKSIAYSGDTEWTEALVEIARNVDLFVVEALSFDKKIPHHMDYATLRANAARIGAKRIVLTHPGPDMLARAHEADHVIAEDGAVFEL